MSIRSQVEKIATSAAILYVKMYYPTLIRSQNKALSLGKVTKVDGDQVTVRTTSGSEKTVTNISSRAVGNDSSTLLTDDFMIG